MRVALVAPAASDAAEAAGEVGPVHGVVVSVKGAGGFVRCCDRDARVYFSMADVDPASIPSRLPRPAAAAGERQQAGGSVGGANGDAGREDAEAQGHGGRDEVRRRATLPSGYRLPGGFLWTGSSLGLEGMEVGVGVGVGWRGLPSRFTPAIALSTALIAGHAGPLCGEAQAPRTAHAGRPANTHSRAGRPAGRNPFAGGAAALGGWVGWGGKAREHKLSVASRRIERVPPSRAVGAWLVPAGDIREPDGDTSLVHRDERPDRCGAARDAAADGRTRTTPTRTTATPTRTTPTRRTNPAARRKGAARAAARAARRRRTWGTRWRCALSPIRPPGAPPDVGRLGTGLEFLGCRSGRGRGPKGGGAARGGDGDARCEK